MILATACGRLGLHSSASEGTGGSGDTGASTTTGRETGGESTGQTGGTSVSSGGHSGGRTSGSSGSTGQSSTSGTSAGQTSSGSGTGSTGGTRQCVLVAAPNELHPCAGDSDCECPLRCVQTLADPSQSICEYPCQVLSDCPTLYTDCNGGTCQPNFCGPNKGEPVNGGLDSTCTVVAGADGSCAPFSLNGAPVGFCFQGGGSDGGCDPSAVRSQLPAACAADLFCVPQGNDAGACAELCDPFAMDPCGVGRSCSTPLAGNTRLGVCEPSATSGGTTSGGATGGNGCGAAVPVSEFSPCSVASDCGCPLGCVSDPLAGGQVCEYPCAALSDCPNLVTTCDSQGTCAVLGCGGFTGNGTYNSTCNAVGTNDGTCVPLTLDGGATVGYCYEAGTATTSCDPTASRSDLTAVCPAGQECFGGTPTFGGQCNQLCDPSGSGTTCPFSQFCTGIVNEPLLGICISF